MCIRDRARQRPARLRQHRGRDALPDLFDLGSPDDIGPLALKIGVDPFHLHEQLLPSHRQGEPALPTVGAVGAAFEQPVHHHRLGQLGSGLFGHG